MSGNTFGKRFCVTTAGESHGPAYVAIVDGCPSNLSLCAADIQQELDRRKPGASKLTSQRQESDTVEILSGVFEGKTTGTPIALLIRNEDARSSDYAKFKEVYRPGHADYVYQKKYGIRDYRGGGRASARETMLRVAAGAIAKKYLNEQCGIEISGSVSGITEALIEQLRREGDSIGAEVTVIARNVPVGLGSPVFDKLSADIAKAMMSINAVKAVGIGDGFAVATQRGSEHRDAMDESGFLSNHAGGIVGGISTGQDILVTLALKPTSSITQPIKTVDVYNQSCEVKVTGRHDPCVGIRAVPVAEAMLALVIMDHYL